METRGCALPLNLLIRHLLAGESYSAEVSQAVRRELYYRCGLYYELREEYKLALECYSKSGSSPYAGEPWETEKSLPCAKGGGTAKP